jgi:regulator of replication initiation timing
VYSQQLEGGEANSFSNIIIGKNRHGGAKYHGNIDDVYIYNRAINDAEVARLFDGGLEDSDGDGLTDDYEVGKGRYKAIAGKMSWDEAMQDAEEKGGHIATITSEAEWHAIKEELGTIPHGYYLGGTDEKTEGVWEWITGEAWEFTKWARGEPNNYFRSQYGDEDRLQTWTATADGNRLWNDIYDSKNPWSKGYVLEFGYYSNPYSKDSDGDGYDDGKEVLAKTDPNNPFSRPMPNITLPKTGPGAPPAPDYVETISKLTDKLMEKEVENQELSQTNAVLEENLAELNSTNQVLVSRVNDLESQVGKLKSKVQDLDTQVVALTKENQDISMQLQNVSHERDNLANDIVVKDEQLEEAVRVAQTPFINGWVYDNTRGWLFTDADHFPLVYTNKDQSWNYYELGSSSPRYFFNFKSQQWEAWDALPEESATDLATNNNL